MLVQDVLHFTRFPPELWGAMPAMNLGGLPTISNNIRLEQT